MHGRYPIARESSTGRKYVLRSDGIPLRETAQISPRATASGPTAGLRSISSANAFGPAEFVQAIRAAVKPGSPISRAK
jgi:hypothetical protein